MLLFIGKLILTVPVAYALAYPLRNPGSGEGVFGELNVIGPTGGSSERGAAPISKLRVGIGPWLVYCADCVSDTARRGIACRIVGAAALGRSLAPDQKDERSACLSNTPFGFPKNCVTERRWTCGPLRRAALMRGGQTIRTAPRSATAQSLRPR